MHIKGLLFLLISACSLIATSAVFSFEKATHWTINRSIAESEINGFSLDGYLKTRLDFDNGKNEVLIDQAEKKEIWRWIADGGKSEDEPPLLRPFNHFHNPLREWNKAGLKGTDRSSIRWAQKERQLIGGNWSWHDARRYFYDALIANNKVDRDVAFAKTFRALGQLMHLVQDASVPAHVRDDIHAQYNYEDWVDRIRLTRESKFQDFVAYPSSFDPGILDQPKNDLAPIPIAKIIDTDQYNMDGKNPEVTLTDHIGIAEYTNANFFSEDTIEYSKFPHPKLEGLMVDDYLIPDPRDISSTATRQYYIYRDVDEITNYKLAAVSFTRQYSEALGFHTVDEYSMDGWVYEDYAARLLPRAVGYSAGLLQYFFRGNLQVTAVPIIYGKRLNFMQLKIKNLTPNEAMQNGAFVVTYRYTPAGAPEDGSEDVFGQASDAVTGSYSVPCIYLGSGEEMEAEFTMFPNYLPMENLKTLKFTLAFKGTLGKEEKNIAVIGKVFSPGEVKFYEEWDNGLTGNHTWGHTDINLDNRNPDNGISTNVFVGDILVKDNIRYEGGWRARVNQTAVDEVIMNGQFKDILPIPVTPNTYFQFKIDDLSINRIPPAPAGYTRQWQGLWLTFSGGLILEFTQEGQGLRVNSTTAGFTFPLGNHIWGNIYDDFAQCEIPIPEGPFYLRSIDFVQQLADLDSTDPALEYHQHMEVDYIQIIEGSQQ